MKKEHKMLLIGVAVGAVGAYLLMNRGLQSQIERVPPNRVNVYRAALFAGL